LGVGGRKKTKEEKEKEKKEKEKRKKQHYIRTAKSNGKSSDENQYSRPSLETIT
jgi:hypothetical protein